MATMTPIGRTIFSYWQTAQISATQNSGGQFESLFSSLTSQDSIRPSPIRTARLMMAIERPVMSNASESSRSKSWVVTIRCSF